MRITFIHLLLSVLSLAGYVQAESIGGKVVFDLRVISNRPDAFLMLSARNEASDALSLDGNRQQDRVVIQRLDVMPGSAPWDPLDYRTGPRGVVSLPAGRSFTLTIRGIASPLDRTLIKGTYGRWRWLVQLVDPPQDIEIGMPPEFLIGYAPAEGGDLRSPYVDTGSRSVSNMLAFVFHQNAKGGIPLDNVPPHELAFLLLNGTEDAIEAVPPLSEGSVLHVTAPGIGYSAAVSLPPSGFEAQTVEPGDCGQWRIPFERILEQIPPETVEAIRAADGALDVVWRAGDLESPPLPLILMPPTQAERDAAFLAEHADVPRIDEHTDLSLDLRLAGIENEPVLLGRLRNNEPHAVLADDRFFDHNNLDSSFRYAPFFTRHEKGRRLFLLNANETVLMSTQFVSLLHDIRDVLMDEGIGRVFCYEWRCHKRYAGPIWLSIPGTDGKIQIIHTYSEKYLPVSEYYRPDLPPIAPLLAYVHNPDTPPELTCVLWNRTEEAIQVADSRIIVTAPAVEYRRELPLPTGLSLPTTVAPGEHTDWRVPWQAIRDMIPADDLTRIEAGGGELDLVWQTGDHTSPPLPILLGWKGVEPPE